MEEGMGSVDRGSDVIKKKSSSGCLIIKKKGNGLLGVGGLDSKKVFESSKENKRSRLVNSDSGSSDEAEPVRRKVREDIIYERRRSGHNVQDTRITAFGSERKRSGLDVFEFDEYDDGFDGKRMKKDYMDDRLELAGRSGNHRDVNIGSSGDFDRRKRSNNERKGSVSGGRSKDINNSGNRRYKVEEDEDDDEESHLPISYLREKCREAPVEPIRLQGKNGVLKVMVNKKKQNFPDKGFDHPRADERSSRSEAAVKKNKMIRPSFYSGSKRPEKTVSRKREKSYLKSRKASPVLSSKSEDSDTDDSEKSLKQETKTEQSQRSKKSINNEHKRTTPTEILTPPTGVKESKVRRGNGTEKQLLREKIRSMLLDRGWRIDYRPRRNRDYLDAVYINPAGTAYWSIIKAYDAFQKQLEEDEDNMKTCGESTSFSPLPEEIISKLTRQTRKKIERELKKKKRDASCIRSTKEVTMRESASCSDSEEQDEKLSVYMKPKNKKGRIHKTDNLSGDDPSDSLHKVKTKLDMAEKQSATKSHMIHGRKSGKIGRCTLLVRSSDKRLNSETGGYVPYTGKRTILSWLIDSEVVNMSEKVQYMNCRKTKVLLKGWITKDGIHCGCCSKILSISKFEIHAGSKQRQPFLNIYLESGLSLMQCQIDAWNKQEESKREPYHHINVDGDDPNDDACGLCGDGGDLMCCDSCPSTFHQSCLDIKMLPAGDWHCPNCTCKFCGLAGRSNAKADDGTDNSLLLCNLCEKKYHQSCCQDVVDLSINPGDGTSHFCGKTCQEIYSQMQKLLGVKHELESGFSWSIVHRIDPALESLHLGYSQRVECNSKLAVALSVMDECFLPIVDRRSRINLIHSVLYNCGSNFTRLNFSGFYTAILERGEEIIAAASIRIHGTQLAEMPFIGTRHIYRRQGMCRRLLSAVELALSILKVEKLIIPAIAEHMNTWTEKFNFSPLEESHKQEMTSMNMLVFPGTDMLQKLVVKREITEGETTKNSGVKFEQDSSPEHELNMSDSSELQPSTEGDNKSSDLISASQILTVPSNDIPAVSSSLVFSCEPATEKTIAVNSVNAETTVICGSTSPNENTCNFVAEKSVVGQLVKGHTQPSLNGFITVEESTTAASEKLVGDVGKIEEDASMVQNSISVRDSISHGTSESTRIDSDMRNHTAVELDDACEVHDNGTTVNSPKDSVEELSAEDIVEDRNLPEISAGNMKEDATAVQNYVSVHDLVSHGTSESTHIDSDTTNHTAVDLDETCEVDVTDTFVNSPKDSVEQLSAEDTVKEDVTGIRTVPECIGDNVVDDTHDVELNDACVKPLMDTYIDADMMNHTAVDLGKTCEVDVTDTFVNSPKDSVEQLSAEDTVKEEVTGIRTVPECNGDNVADNTHDVELNDACVKPLVDTHIESDMTNHAAVDLDKTCEVHVTDTFVNFPKDSVEQLSAEDTVKEDVTGIRTVPECIGDNAVDNTHVVELNDACVEPLVDTHNDCDMTSYTAVDLDRTCEVNETDTFVNSPNDSFKQLSAEDTVKEDVTEIKTVPECIGDNVVENTHEVELNGACVEPLVDTHIDCDMTNYTAVDLDKTCEVNVNHSFVNSLKDSVEQFSAKDTVKEGVTETRTTPEGNGDNVVDDTHEVEVNDTCVESVVDPFNKTLALNGTSQAISKDQSESSFATDVVGDERNGDSKKSNTGE